MFGSSARLVGQPELVLLVILAGGCGADGDGWLRSALEPGAVAGSTALPLLSSTAAWTSTDSQYTYAVAWGDWDTDGDLDLAAANYAGQADGVYENVGGVLAGAPTWEAPVATSARAVALGDWDGDGDLDRAVSNWTTSAVVYENDDGALVPAWTSGSFIVTWVAWGDVDGDGDLDLVTSSAGGVPARVFENLGSGLDPAGSPIWTAPDIPSYGGQIALGDADGDGDLDLFVAHGNGPSKYYENSGSGLEATAATTINSGNGNSPAWGDWDGDGYLDLALGGGGYANNILFGGGPGGPSTSSWVSASTYAPYDSTTVVAWGDHDGDGDIDLVAGNLDQPDLVYENDGSSLTTSPSWFSGESDPTRSIAWGDVDGDGSPDLAVGNATADGGGGAPNRVYENVRLPLTQTWSSGSGSWQAYAMATSSSSSRTSTTRTRSSPRP